MTGGTAEDVVVRLGELAVRRGSGVLVTLGLGSCVAVMLHDRQTGTGGLAHVLLPSRSPGRESGRPARFADQAVPLLVAEMQRAGAGTSGVAARLVGGATMFAQLMPRGAVHMGERNVLACRQALEEAGIPIVGEAVGGEVGRSLWFDVAQGTVTVRSVGRDLLTL